MDGWGMLFSRRRRKERVVRNGWTELVSEERERRLGKVRLGGFGVDWLVGCTTITRRETGSEQCN